MEFTLFPATSLTAQTLTNAQATGGLHISLSSWFVLSIYTVNGKQFWMKTVQLTHHSFHHTLASMEVSSTLGLNLSQICHSLDPTWAELTLFFIHYVIFIHYVM